MTEIWEPKYPIKSLPHDLWENFPDWLIEENDESTAEQQSLVALNKIDSWRNNIIQNLVALSDMLEKDRKESNGEIPVKGCYVLQMKLIELILGCSVKTAKQFLSEMELPKEATE